MTGTLLAAEEARPIAAPPMPIDPRIRARRLEVRRDQRRRPRRIGLVVAIALTVAAAGWGATRSPLLAVRQIEVRGTSHVSRSELVVAAGLDHRRQMLDLGTDQVAARLDTLAWVGRARIERHWPNTVTIAIDERIPVAQMAGPAGQPALVDADGRVLATGSEAAAVLAATVPPLPQLLGVTSAASPGSVVDHAAEGALSLVGRLPKVLAAVGPGRDPGVLKAVSVAADGVLRATLTSGVTVVFGSVDQLATKLVALQAVLVQVNVAGGATVDVRAPDTPVLTTTNGGSIVSTTSRG
jgi:cell division protein FtsQ